MYSVTVAFKVQLGFRALTLDDKVHLELIWIVENRRERQADELTHVIFKFTLRESCNLLDDSTCFI